MIIEPTAVIVVATAVIIAAVGISVCALRMAVVTMVVKVFFVQLSHVSESIKGVGVSLGANNFFIYRGWLVSVVFRLSKRPQGTVESAIRDMTS